MMYWLYDHSLWDNSVLGQRMFTDGLAAAHTLVVAPPPPKLAVWGGGGVAVSCGVSRDSVSGVRLTLNSQSWPQNASIVFYCHVCYAVPLRQDAILKVKVRASLWVLACAVLHSSLLNDSARIILKTCWQNSFVLKSYRILNMRVF